MDNKEEAISSLNDINNTGGALLGVDFGDKRTGLAVSDPSRILASASECVSPGGIERTADAVAEYAVRRGVSGIIVGLPVNMDGSEGPRAARCRKFACLLCKRLTEKGSEMPVAMFDERMTTMTAIRFLNETDTRGSRRKEVIDALSAQIILQNALDRLKNIK